MTKYREWPRLGLTEVIGLDLAEDIRQTIRALTVEGHHEPEWDAQWRFRAAGYLRRLLDSDAAMTALTGGKGSGRRGRPRLGVEIDLALAYVAAREAMGRDVQGSAMRAARKVAKAWSVTVQTVKDAYTRHQASEERRLDELLHRFVGKYRDSDRIWTRDEVLQAIQADCLDRRNARRAAARPCRGK